MVVEKAKKVQTDQIMAGEKIDITRYLRIWIVDTIRILFAGFPFLIYYVRRFIFGRQHKGGFFCDDKSLMLPFQGQTISSKEVLAHTLIVPIVTFVVVEFVCDHKQWIVRSYRTTVNFAIGYLVSVSLMWLPKFFDGGIGLRPHFFDMCQPVMPDGSTCEDLTNHGRYIENYTCSNPNFPQRIYRSFPSGHATVSSFAILFLIMYLQVRVKTTRYRDFKLAFQYLLLLYGVFCSVSRVFDNQHHAVDVIVGALFGSVAAVLVVLFVANRFEYCTVAETGKDVKPECCKAND